MTINQEQKFVTKVKAVRDNRKPAKLMFRFIGMNVWKQKGTRTPYKSKFSRVRRSEPVSLFLTAIVMTFQPLATLTNVATNSSMHEKLIRRIALDSSRREKTLYSELDNTARVLNEEGGEWCIVPHSRKMLTSSPSRQLIIMIVCNTEQCKHDVGRVYTNA